MTYKQLWMKKHREAESKYKRKLRLEKDKLRHRDRKLMMNDSEKAEFREKRRKNEAIRRSNVPDDEHLL